MAVIVAVVWTYKVNNDNYACTMEAKLCPDGSYVGRVGPKCEFAACPGDNQADGTLSEAQARVIAQNSCIKGGESLKPGYYNENSKTWWFDANLNATQQGCNPACVVSEETNTAEINWRCTGLIVPNEQTSKAIQQLFAKKYPQYAKTVTVRVDQETQNHARGSVIFVSGAPGGIFLAAKIDGEWQIVHEGNGQISCALSRYGFPDSMLADCAN